MNRKASEHPANTINVKEVLAERKANTVYTKVDSTEKNRNIADIIANLLSLDNHKITITLENK